MIQNLTSLKRLSTQQAIDFNPTTINFNRVETVYNSITGSNETIESIYTEIIRITKNNNFELTLNQDIGVYKKANSFVLLANYLSNMSNKFKDTFVYNEENYIIKSVMKMIEKEEITSIQAIAEVIIE